MTPDNPYAPPKAEVADVATTATAPALWNPNAAANWSLLFSPIFGAVLHMKNWQALGEPARASASRAWVVAGVAMFVVLTLVSALVENEKGMDALSRAAVLGLLIAWYFASARQQAAFVKARFGSDYPRKGWAKPMLLALLAFAGFIAALGAIGFVVGVIGAM